MTKFISVFLLICILTSCTNDPELETSEIELLTLLKNSIIGLGKPKGFVDARKLLSRQKIDEFAIPILFVELETGQNGTLTRYPGKGIGQTWLGSDGATITLDQGVLLASRGMGNDLMGVSSSMPSWKNIKNNGTTYIRKTSYLGGNNQLNTKNLICSIENIGKLENIVIWDVDFTVKKYEELCKYNDLTIKNIFYLDDSQIVRSSYQYHSETIGYLKTERLDR